MTTNADVIRLALKIADVDKRAARHRSLAASACISARLRDDLLHDAAGLDDDLCRLCTEMRLLCLPQAVKTLPDAVAATIMDEFT